MAQTGAVNGSIRGQISDASSGGVRNAQIRATNLDTGFVREVQSGPDGSYDLPLLPLGRYEVRVQVPGFSDFEQQGITVESSRVSLLNIPMQVASSGQSVTVVSDATVLTTDSAGIPGSLNLKSIGNMPLTSRNLTNLALFVPGFTGKRDDEFGNTQFAFGGMQRRGFLTDGIDTSQRGGVFRLGIFSAESVQEIRVLQNAFSAEYGRTSGGIVNIITRGGTNEYHGSFLYLGRRPGLIARPSLLPRTTPTPFQQWTTWSGNFGGPVIKDKLWFFVNAEYQPIDYPKAITISAANAAALNLPASDLGATKFSQRFQTYLGRTDYQINAKNAGFFRYGHFRTPSGEQGSGLVARSSLNVFDDKMETLGFQLTTTATPAIVNEFRSGFSRRRFFRPPVLGDLEGQEKPIVIITGVATLGSNGAANERYLEEQVQFIDNVSLRAGSHDFKFGADVANILLEQSVRLNQTFQFGGIPGVATALQQYLNTVNRVANPATGQLFTYTQLTQQLGDNRASHRTWSYNFFAMDDWRIRPNLTLSLGVRYELLAWPELDKTAPLEISRTIPNDSNNFMPRIGFVWQPGPKGVLRGGYGIFFDTMNLRLLTQVIRNNGQRVLNYTVAGGSAGAPTFPAGLTAPNPAFGQRSNVWGFDRNFRTNYSHQANLQYERELVHDLSLTIGVQWYGGRRLPLVRDTNLGGPVRLLADGRPVYSNANRPETRFSQINLFESVGRARYYGGFVAVTKRFSHGLQLTASYTLGYAQNDTDSIGDSGATVTDPSNIRRDYSVASSDQRHRFVMQGVWEPRLRAGGLAGMAVNGWRFSPNVTLTSGFPINIVQGQDLNGDGNNNDRPLFRGRNDVLGPGFSEINFRVSREFPLYGERLRLELIGEAENLFNSTNVACGISGCTGALVNNVMAADLFRATQATNSRQVQIGGRIRF
ncbi:MAG: TonB-dependent receptor [Bryobacteraceae bacterium]|nr:TonB-dependent receptor [Bryobacteraceae bacterium]